MPRLLGSSYSTSVCFEKERGREKKQAAELYIFLMEGDTVGALRINLDARVESWSTEKMANISVAQ